jgi:hypothetical protein
MKGGGIVWAIVEQGTKNKEQRLSARENSSFFMIEFLIEFFH